MNWVRPKMWMCATVDSNEPLERFLVVVVRGRDEYSAVSTQRPWIFDFSSGPKLNWSDNDPIYDLLLIQIRLKIQILVAAVRGVQGKMIVAYNSRSEIYNLVNSASVSISICWAFPKISAYYWTKWAALVVLIQKIPPFPASLHWHGFFFVGLITHYDSRLSSGCRFTPWL